MANEKTSSFTAASAFGATDKIFMLQAGANVIGTPAQMKTWTSASPTLVTPVLGVATATSINKLTFTAPATSATLTIVDGKTLTVSKTLSFTGTDSTTMTFPATSATIARTDAANTFTGVQTFSSLQKLSGDTTGAVTPLGLGTNCPAVSGAAPYTWLAFTSSDGSTVYVPAYK